MVLDWWLPVEDGLSVLKRLRQSDRQTPVLFLTARDAVDQRVQGLGRRGRRLLSKPFAFEELLARIAPCAAARRSCDSVLTFRDLQLDLKTQRSSGGSARWT